MRQLILNRLKNTQKKRNLITFTNADSIITEEYRTIRTNIQFLMDEQKCKSILITSPSLNEGKSTTIANLAVSMAQQKDKVLVIDADLRNPRMHSIFKVDNLVGLSSILATNNWVDGAITKMNIGNLDIMTSGPVPDNPAELLGSKTFHILLNKVIENYDVVLIDSPPVLEVTDTKLLANKCDGVVLVLKHGKSKIEKAIEAKKVLKITKAKLIGAIINEKS